MERQPELAFRGVTSLTEEAVKLLLTCRGPEVFTSMSQRHLQVFLCTAPVTAPPTGLPVYCTCHSATYRSSCVLYLSQRHLQVFLCTVHVTAPPTGLPVYCTCHSATYRSSCVLYLSQRNLQVFLCTVYPKRVLLSPRERPSP